MDKEVIKGYLVNKNGDVYSLHRNRNIKQHMNAGGYMKVRLSVDGVTTNYYVHRLVAMAYIPNQLKQKQVNHKDFNKSNNILENLEWVSPINNLNHFLHAAGYRQADDYVIRDRVQERFNSLIDAGVSIENALYSIS